MIVRYQNVDGFEVTRHILVATISPKDTSLGTSVTYHSPELVRLTLVGAAFGNERRQREFTLDSSQLRTLLWRRTVECGVVVKLKLEKIEPQEGLKRQCLVVEETGETFIYVLDDFLAAQLEEVLDAAYVDLLSTPPLDPRATT